MSNRLGQRFAQLIAEMRGALGCDRRSVGHVLTGIKHEFGFKRPLEALKPLGCSGRSLRATNGSHGPPEGIIALSVRRAATPSWIAVPHAASPVTVPHPDFGRGGGGLWGVGVFPSRRTSEFAAWRPGGVRRHATLWDLVEGIVRYLRRGNRETYTIHRNGFLNGEKPRLLT